MLGASALIAVMFGAILEVRLALRGFQATVQDSEARWIAERVRATRLGERALILIGGSRSLLGLDLDVLRQQTGLEPVQLAIDGNSFRPVLAGLASDPAITGTVVVDFYDHLLIHPGDRTEAHRWQAAFEHSRGEVSLPTFERSERWLTDAWRGRLRSYADGAQPLTSILVRLMPTRPAGQYLVSRRDRSMEADYSRVEMPRFYLQRVVRNLGSDSPPLDNAGLAEVEHRLAQRISSLKPNTELLEIYRQSTGEIAKQVAALQARGARVYFVVMPTSGLVRMIEERRYPRELFWDRFIAEVGAPGLHRADQAWGAFQCPDGSHLDVRQRRAFSAALATSLRLDR